MQAVDADAADDPLELMMDAADPSVDEQSSELMPDEGNPEAKADASFAGEIRSKGTAKFAKARVQDQCPGTERRVCRAGYACC
jgi:hypothetical protein